MKARIESVLQSESSFRVRFNTEVGAGIATWNASTEPQASRTYDVEIDIDEVIDLSRNSRIVSNSRMGISGDESVLKITGVVDDQDDDGMAYIRVGTDCLIMVEAIEMDLKGKFLELSVLVQFVELHPTGGVVLSTE